MATIRRGCGRETSAEDTCWERETDDKKYRWKDCQQSCDKNMCNNDLSVGDKIVEDKIKDLSCFQYKWREEVHILSVSSNWYSYPKRRNTGSVSGTDSPISQETRQNLLLVIIYQLVILDYTVLTVSLSATK